MRIVVAGASGLIGNALVPGLRDRGHDVVRLVRRPAAGPDEISWDPAAGILDPASLDGVEAAVNLGGVNLGDKRWSPTFKHEILASRLATTGTLAAALAALPEPPRVLVNGSAIGYYGDTGDTEVDEAAPPGEGFLADVVVQWEAATAPAVAAGIRTVLARTGLVVAPGAGAFGKLVPIFKLGGGGRLGSGRQYWSFISLTDEVRALTHLLERDTFAGAVNLTAPHPVTNAEAVKALGAVLHRPSLLPVPAFALRAVVGEFAEDILGSARVRPTVLLEAGFAFEHPSIEAALRAELAA